MGGTLFRVQSRQFISGLMIKKSFRGLLDRRRRRLQPCALVENVESILMTGSEDAFDG